LYTVMLPWSRLPLTYGKEDGTGAYVASTSNRSGRRTAASHGHQSR
jgi:hypothetical protein